MITPSIGRVVWFYPTKSYRESHAPGQPDDQPWKADITYVWTDRMVNLTAATPSGSEHYGVTGVTLVQEGDDVPDGSYYCAWMPWQLGQAKQK